MARSPRLDPRTVQVPLEDRPGIALVFDPPRRAPDGAVVIVPGLTVRAHMDPRLAGLGRAFAAAGLRGIVLEIPDLAELHIRQSTEADLAARLSVLCDEGLIPHDRLGLLGPSFSGSLALRAAAHEASGGRVRSVVTVGAFADAARTVRFLFEDERADPYGRLVLMLNFLQTVQQTSPQMLRALRIAIADTAIDAGPPELADALGALPEAERETLSALLTEPEAWREAGERMITEGEDWLDAMSVEPIVQDLDCSVFVMHGAHDNIVPPSESEELHRLLLQAGRPSHLVITKLLDHASIQIGLDVVRQAWRMHAGFAFFLAGMGL